MRKQIISILEYFLVFLIILEFNTVYYIFPPIARFYRYAPIFVLVVLIYLRKRYFSLPPVVVMFLIGALLPFFNVRGEAMLNYIRSFVLFIPMVTIYLEECRQGNKEAPFSLLCKYSDIMFLFALSSILLFIPCSYMEIIEPTLWIPTDWSGYDSTIPLFFGIYSQSQEVTLLGVDLIRNCGVFTEGPMHNMALCVALSIEIFVRKAKSNFRITVFVITIITTFTTTGLIFLMILLVWKLHAVLNGKSRSLLYFCYPFVLIMILVSVSILKEDKQNNGTNSYDRRQEDIERCVEVGIDNPVLGVELYHLERNSLYGTSNSLFTIFAHGGFYTLALYFLTLLIFPLLNLRPQRRHRDLAFLVLLFFFLFSITISHYKQLTFLLMAHSMLYLAPKFISNNRKSPYTNQKLLRIDSA